MFIDIFLTLVAVATFLFLGAVVYFHDKKSITNIIFALISIITTLYVLSNFMSVHVPPEKVLFWIRLTIFFAAPHALLFLIFIHNFPQRNLVTSRGVLVTLLTVLIFAMFAALSPFVFSEIVIQKGGGVLPIPGVLMPFFSGMIVASLVWGIILMIKKFVRAKDTKKRQWASVFIGVGSSYFLLVTLVLVGVVFFKKPFFVKYVPLFFLPSIVSMAYAILRHHLFNVKVIATEIFTFIILVATLFQVFLAETTLSFVISLGTTVFLFIFGILLIRSVLQEVRAREEIQALAQKLEKANRHLEELLKMKSEFLAIASHQLRTPLTALRGLLSMQAEGDFDRLPPAKHKQAQLDMLTSANRLNNIVNDLLDAMELEGGIKLEPQPVQVEKLIEEAMQSLKPNYDKKGLYLKFKKPVPVLPKIQAEPAYLREVFMNLIDNAEKYTEKGGTTISASQADNLIEVRVKDTGVGISLKDKKKLFQKFSRGEKAALIHTDGSGLGLFIVKKILEEHDSKIIIESPGKDKGSTFIVRIPIKQPR